MAIYDRNEDRIVVRVVYDGLGNAGKSTNLRALCNFFTLRRRSELYVPEERDGRTLYFDWLQIESGLVGGHRLRCQVMSVPGQLVLRERRARLLQTADVIVLVCDSTPEGVERVSRGFARTRRFVTEHVGEDVKFIVQANKQDLPGALSVEEIAQALGSEDLRIVPARANESIGVRETVVLAIRAAADRVQQILLERGLDAMSGEAQSPESLYREMREAELGASDTLSLDALLDDEDAALDPTSIVPAASPGAMQSPSHGDLVSATDQISTEIVSHVPTEARSESLTPAAPTLHSAGPIVAAVSSDQLVTPASSVAAQEHTVSIAPPARNTTPTLPAGTDVAPFTPFSAELTTTQPAQARAQTELEAKPTELIPTPFVYASDATPTLAPEPRDSQRPDSATPPRADTSAEAQRLISAIVTGTLDWPTPPIDVSKVPSGLVWPSGSGRETLRSLEHGTPRPIFDSVAQSGARDGSGKSGFVLYEVAGIAFKTDPSRTYTNLDHARDALVALVRTKMCIGALAPSQTVLAVQEDGDIYRLWTVAPWCSTLSSRLSAARDARDEEAVGDALCDFAQAAAEALQLRVRQDILLDLHPSNFAKSDGRMVYLDDEIKRGGSVYPIVHAILQRVEELGEYAQAQERYLQALHDQLRSHLSAVELMSLDLLQQLIEITPRAAAAESARMRIIAGVRQVLREQERRLSSVPPAPAAQPFRVAASVAPAAIPSDRPTRPVLANQGFDAAERTSEYVIPREPIGQVIIQGDEAESRAMAARDGFEPPLPQNADELPSGYIWPAATGRELVKQLATTFSSRDISESMELRDASRIYQAGRYKLSTSLAERFQDPDEGRAELLRRARAQVQITGLAATTTVLVLVPSAQDGSHWLWTIETGANAN